MEYRVDIFGNDHTIRFFENEKLAREYADKVSKHSIVFLMRKTTSPGIYDLVELIG